MAHDVKIAGATYPSVPAVDLAKPEGGTQRFVDTSDATANPDGSEIADGKTAYINGQKVIGSMQPGGGTSFPTLANQAQSGDILSGKSAYDDQGNEVQGGIAAQSDSGNTTLTAVATSKSYPAGYYPNAHGAQVSVEQKTGLTLNALPFTIDASTNKLMSSAQISALGGEFYRVFSGTLSVASDQSSLSFTVGFEPVFAGVYILGQNTTTQNKMVSLQNLSHTYTVSSTATVYGQYRTSALNQITSNLTTITNNNNGTWTVTFGVPSSSIDYRGQYRYVIYGR